MLTHASRVPYWLDTPDRPPARPALVDDLHVDLAVVGGGFTGLWTALLALEREPARSVVLLEANRLAWAATGRNGGFCSASLTHGTGNGHRRWPEEMPLLTRLGHENLDAIESTVAAEGIDCGFERTGELTAATQPWQTEELRAVHALARRYGEEVELLDAHQARSLVDSPLILSALHDARGTALVDPARLAWGLAEAAERRGATLLEKTRVVELREDSDRIRLRTTTSGRVREEATNTRGPSIVARQVVLGTNVFPSPLRRLRPFVVPVWDHVVVTEPLSPEQRAAVGWAGRQGFADAGNRFHYSRLTRDGRILWGGYDALYYFGSDLSVRRETREQTEQLLAAQLVETFPALEGIRVSHTWGGAIDTSTRFTPFWARAFGGKLASVQGYTGLGVGSSRFGAQVALDLVEGRDSRRTRLAMVRRPPVPFPPEPLRWAAIQATRRSIARADAREGRRGPWLQVLDRLGLGFDS
jgi:glycine/D-amino acid oxidase-like deaminating enzyme